MLGVVRDALRPCHPRHEVPVTMLTPFVAHLAPVSQEEHSQVLASAIIAYEMWCETAAVPDAPLEWAEGEEGEELL